MGSASKRPVSLSSDSEEGTPARKRESVRASRSTSPGPSRSVPKTSKRQKVGRGDNSPIREASADPRRLDEGAASRFGATFFSSSSEEEAYIKVAKANAKVSFREPYSSSFLCFRLLVPDHIIF